MYSLKAHGAPDMPNSLFGGNSPLNYLGERNFVTVMSQPENPPRRPSSLSFFQQNLFPISTACFLFSRLSPSFSWLLYLSGELAFFIHFCLLPRSTDFQFLASFLSISSWFFSSLWFSVRLSPAGYFKKAWLRKRESCLLHASHDTGCVIHVCTLHT